MSVHRCNKHGGYGFVSDCAICNPERAADLSEPNDSAPDETIARLRGQLQNCVNHLELLKRNAHRSCENKIDSCIESANQALYETLIR